MRAQFKDYAAFLHLQKVHSLQLEPSTLLALHHFAPPSFARRQTPSLWGQFKDYFELRGQFKDCTAFLHLQKVL